MVDYIAFDLGEKDRAACETAIARVYGSPEGRFLSQKSAINRYASSKPFDIVVMCNVLHEINPTLWPSIFTELSQLLANDGAVFIVEDLEIPHGELAFQEGFVLLDLPAVQRLFGLPSQSSQIAEAPPPPKYENRLVGYLINAEALRNVNTDTVKDALTWTHRQAILQVEDLRRSGDTSYRAGLRHGLYCQQIVNTELILKRLG